jgi:PAS domain S-box-containing protein
LTHEGLRGADAVNRWIVESDTDLAIIATDRAGRVTSWNAGAQQMLGWSEHEMLGQTLDRIVTAEDSATGDRDCCYVRKDGARFWGSAKTRPLLDDANAPAGSVLLLRDRTERHRAGEALSRSEASIRSMLNSIAEGFYAVDTEGNTTVCNAAFLRMMGFASERDALGRKLHGIIHHSHANGAHYAVEDCPIYTCAREGTAAHVTHEVFFPVSGPPLPVEYWAIPIIEDGKLQGAICTFLDITDRIAAETARNASDERYRSLFNSLDVGFCIIEMAYDADGKPVDYKFVEVNPAFARHTGLHDATAQWMRSLVPNDEQRWFDIYGSVAKTGIAVRFEDVADELDQRFYDVHAFRIGDPGAHRVAVLFNDISDRRKTELALQQLNRTLDARVAETVAERERALEALRQSQKLEAIGQLTGGVAHDFNNLLTVIRGSADLLRRADLNEERRARYIAAIADTADRAATLTGQLLAFARRQALKPECFDVGASVRAVQAMITTLVGSRVSIEIALPETPCYIDADPSQFDTAIINMAVNARDAMGNEGRLAIAIAPVDQMPSIRRHPPVDGDFVAVAVSDTGSGIAPDDIDRIFEPFFTTKGVGEGTGLGLSQVFGFAKQSGGEVLVESTPGQTTFTLYLPRASAADLRRQAVVPEAAIGDGGGRCVLVVEDNAGVGEFATASLAELGFDSVLASNAAEALDALVDGADRFQIVFSDVVMPGMNGIDLARTIERLYPGLPVVLTSGYSDVLVREGSDGFEILGKPYSLEELQRTLHRRARKLTVG